MLAERLRYTIVNLDALWGLAELHGLVLEDVTNAMRNSFVLGLVERSLAILSRFTCLNRIELSEEALV